MFLMFNLFEIYRNHKRYLWIKHYGLHRLEDFDSRIETRQRFINDGEDVEHHQRCIQNYKSSKIMINQLLDTDYKLLTFFGIRSFIRDFKHLDEFIQATALKN